MKELFTDVKRAYYYRVIGAGGAIAFAYGLLDANELAVWLGAAAVVLNVMPIVNTSTKQ